MSIAARPLYFESGRESLFGWLHLPPENHAFDLGIVICKPFGYESICADGSIRAFADACASAGAAVLRFDYTGTGDSSGRDTERDEIAQWLADIGAAMAALRSHTRLTRIGLLGVRFGALLANMLAAQDSSVDLVISVSPVVNGRRYVRELRAFQVTSSSDAGGEVEVDSGIEVTGFRLSQASIDRLGTVDLHRCGHRAPSDTLILDRSDLPVAKSWVDAVEALGTKVDYRHLPGLLEMIDTPHAARVPEKCVAAILEYLTNLRSRLPQPARIPSTVKDCTASMQLAAENGLQLLERALFLDEKRTLFAICTELQRHCQSSLQPGAGHGIIMLNCGATSHIGPNRMYVDLARRWAARGYCVMRMDLAGLGDSAPRAGQAPNEVYPAHALDDVAAAIAYLRRERDVQNITLAGLCSGAYHSLRSALSNPHVDTVLLINPLTFYWKQGSKLSDLQDAEVVRNPGIYAKRVLSRKSWGDVFAGRVNLWRILLIYLRRPLLTLNSKLRDLSRKLHIRLPYDLGWELRALASRGVRIVFFFARDDVGRDLLLLQGGSVVKSNQGHCRVHIIEDADHIFSQRTARRKLVQLLTGELPHSPATKGCLPNTPLITST